MDPTANPTATPESTPPAAPVVPEFEPEESLRKVSTLLESVDGATTACAETPKGRARARHESRLVEARLGVAGGLFAALRVKDPTAAAHCLRVALGCSAWSISLKLDDEQRNQLEIAALLHDIGKIGVPDRVLLKPGRLSREEAACMNAHHRHGLEILASCCLSQEIIDIVRFTSAWYDGEMPDFDVAGADLPFGSRMVAIVDAFDSMTSDHIWRRAMSRERAIAELFDCSGRQFDPELVRHFCTLQSQDPTQLHRQVIHRWLHDLDPQVNSQLWSPDGSPQPTESSDLKKPFYVQFVEHMHDAIVFVDTDMRIGLWNQAAEQMTGIPAGSLLQRRWSCELLNMFDERRRKMPERDCPLRQAMERGMPLLRRLTITGRGQRQARVNAHAIPVLNSDGTKRGAILQLHDASSETNLEQRVQSLHEKATHDSLTKVANRAEFDRALQRMVKSHVARQLPCSLIIGDLDHFKRINDTYGHQAGDEVLTTVAGLLKRKCRQGDLVARYGGEEFVMLCADCDNAAATSRAEDIRRELAALPQGAVGGAYVTGSFGVTELQAGDTPETMLRRADRALYQAKDRGRNIVVQLGTGYQEVVATPKRSWWTTLFGGPAQVLLERQLVTTVPIHVAVEKLRGFIADHHAEIVSIDEERVVLKIDAAHLPQSRRATDRPVPFVIELTFSEKRVETRCLPGQESGKVVRTFAHVIIRPRRNRDRRRRDADQRAAELLMSVKSYLMAHEMHEIDDRTRMAISPDDATEADGEQRGT
jgi:diguanylate cyclase (GGDEF)-like protein/PAS domain S-box-containing protein